MRDWQAQPYLHENQAVGELDSLHGQQQVLMLLGHAATVPACMAL